MAVDFSFSFRVTDAAGDPVGGLGNADFICSAYRDGGVTSDVVTIAAVQGADGIYKATGTATDADRYHVVIKANNAQHAVNGSRGTATFDVDALALAGINAAAGAIEIAFRGFLYVDDSMIGLSDMPAYTIWRPGGGLLSAQDVNAQAAAVHRIRRGEKVLLWTGDASYEAGSIFCPYEADPDDWRPGDVHSAVFSGPAVTVNGVTTQVPPLTVIIQYGREQAILERGVLGATYGVTIDVLDLQGHPVPGVVLRVADADGNNLTQVVTDASRGRAALNMEAGAYRFHPSKSGYGFAGDFFERTVSASGALDAIAATPLAVAAPTDPGRCRVYHYADEADAPAVALSGSAAPYPRPQFSGAAGGRSYVGLTDADAELAQVASGFFYFDDLKRGATYLFTIDREGIDSTNGVLAVPTDFTGGTPGIAYLVQDADGRLVLSVLPPS